MGASRFEAMPSSPRLVRSYTSIFALQQEEVSDAGELGEEERRRGEWTPTM
jgi:hypothetical protein